MTLSSVTFQKGPKRDGRSWAEALDRLAEVIGIKPTNVKEG